LEGGFPVERVRVIHYRQHKADVTIIEAHWLTNFPELLSGAHSECERPIYDHCKEVEEETEDWQKS